MVNSGSAMLISGYGARVILREIEADALTRSMFATDVCCNTVARNGWVDVSTSDKRVSIASQRFSLLGYTLFRYSK